jgi:hypothetical protein
VARELAKSRITLPRVFAALAKPFEASSNRTVVVLAHGKRELLSGDRPP